MAKKGAGLAAPPEYLLARERITRTFAKTVQRMLVHVWAAEKGIIHEKGADGHEANIDDSAFGFEHDDMGEGCVDEFYVNAFEELLEETHPGELATKAPGTASVDCRAMQGTMAATGGTTDK